MENTTVMDVLTAAMLKSKQHQTARKCCANSTSYVSLKMNWHMRQTIPAITIVRIAGCDP